jgi:hypothetical protein
MNESSGVLHIYGAFFTQSAIMVHCSAVTLHQKLQQGGVPLYELCRMRMMGWGGGGVVRDMVQKGAGGLANVVTVSKPILTYCYHVTYNMKRFIHVLIKFIHKRKKSDVIFMAKKLRKFNTMILFVKD